MTKRPAVDDILALVSRCETYYSNLYNAFGDDERSYELDFMGDLGIPDQFLNDAIITPTARDMVDMATDNTDVSNARVFVNKKNTSEVSRETAEMLRRFALGLIHRTNVENDISPQRVSSKHYWLHGLACIKSCWDADNWIDKPEQKEGESEDHYAARIEEWRSDHPNTLPIILQAVHPAHLMPDPSRGGRLYVIEKRRKLTYDAERIWPHWKNKEARGSTETVECVSYWDNKYRCELVDGQPVIRTKNGVVEHNYGFIPYTLVESGLGNVSIDALPEKRYVGLLRYIKRLLRSESANYSLCDILMKKETMKGGYITGADAANLGKIRQEYGKYWPVGDKDVEFHDWESKMAPSEAYQHLALTRDYLALHGAPRAMRGVGEPGVRSAADRRLLMGQAGVMYKFAELSFANGWANILTKCCRLVKDVIPGDFRIWWAKSPYDEFDMEVKKSLFKEPFNFYVEFAPISEEDEYRRHDDLIRRKAAGLIDAEYAWQKQNDVDPSAMRTRVMKEKLRAMPMYNQMIDMEIAKMFKEMAESQGIQYEPPQPNGNPPQESQGPENPGRNLVPPIPERAMPGSYAEMENAWRQARSQTPMSATQGRGINAGGNKY